MALRLISEPKGSTCLNFEAGEFKLVGRSRPVN